MVDPWLFWKVLIIISVLMLWSSYDKEITAWLGF